MRSSVAREGDHRDRLPNRRQGRPGVNRGRRVVETRDRKQPRHANARFMGGDHHARRGIVVAGDDGGGPIGDLPQGVEPALAGIEVEPPVDDQIRIDVQAVIAKTVQVSREAPVAGAMPGIALDEPYAAMPQRQHVLGQRAARFGVVRIDRYPVGIRLSRRDERECNTALDEQRSHVRAVGDRCREQQTVDARLTCELANQGRRRILVARARHQGVSARLARGRGAFQELLDIAELVRVFVEQADGEGAMASESARRGVRLVVERRDGVQYAFPGRRTDVRFVVDDPRDRLDRHAGEFGDFADRRAAVSPHISPRAAMIAQDFARVRVLGAFSRGARGGTPRKKTAARGGTPRQEDSSARGHPSQEKRRKHSHALWCSDHVRARGQKCPTGGTFGSARGPTPPCEGAASALCIRRDFRKTDAHD